MQASAYSSQSMTVTGARGLWLTTDDGHRYLDACAGTFNVGLGYGHKAVTDAVRKVLDIGILHGSSSICGKEVGEAEALLAAIAPTGLDRVHLKGCTGGSTAVEQALRHAWAYTGRTRVVSFINGHHGQTIVSTLASGMQFRKRRLRHATIPITNVPAPDCYRCPFGKVPESCNVQCADEVVRAATDKDDAAAAFLAEPVLGAGGGIIPPRLFWHKVADGLQRARIPLILDEVQTFGRLNGFFAADYYGIQPTMIALAKSISGIGVPGAGALLLPKELCILEQGERSLTWGGSSIVGAAIAATVRVMNSDGFFASVQRSGEMLHDSLNRLMTQSRFIGCVRNVGLMSGVELVHSKESRQPYPKFAEAVIRECKHEGLLVRQSEYGLGAFVKIRPALTATSDEVLEIVRRFSLALNRCERTQ